EAPKQIQPWILGGRCAGHSRHPVRRLARAAGGDDPLQPVPTTGARRQGGGCRHLGPLRPGHAQGSAARRRDALRHHARRARARRRAGPPRGALLGPHREHLAPRPAVPVPADPALRRRLVLPWPPPRGRPGRLNADRQEQGQGLRRVRHRRDVQGRRRRGRGQGRVARDRGLPARARALRPPRRPDAERRAAGGAAGHGQDTARQGGRGRGEGGLLLHLRRRIRGDVRGRRRGPGARPVRAGTGQGAGHHLHRRVGRAGPRPWRGRPLRRRAFGSGADVEPAPGGDGRLRFALRPGHHRRDQPAGNPRPGAAARRPLRPPGSGGPAGQVRARGHPQRPPAQGDARAGRGCGKGGGADAGLHRRGPRQLGQRSRAARHPPRRRRRHHGRLQQRGGAHYRRLGEAQPAAQSARARDRRLPRDGARARRPRPAGGGPGPQGVDHPARRRRARLHDPAPDGRPLPDDARGAGAQNDGAARRARRGADRVQPPLHRRRRRPPARHGHRPRHGGPLRHVRAARQRRLRARRAELPRRPGHGDGAARARLRRGHGQRDRRRGARHHGRRPGAHPRPPAGAARRAGALRPALAGEGNAGRGGVGRVRATRGRTIRGAAAGGRRI
ncbi:MAG: Cell division protein FtsH, partial [uncultured Acetobacteraceae bacterium]